MVGAWDIVPYLTEYNGTVSLGTEWLVHRFGQPRYGLTPCSAAEDFGRAWTLAGRLICSLTDLALRAAFLAPPDGTPAAASDTDARHP